MTNRSEKFRRNIILPVEEHPLEPGHCPAQLLQAVVEALVDGGRAEEDRRLHLGYRVVEGVHVVHQVAARGIIYSRLIDRWEVAHLSI